MNQKELLAWVTAEQEVALQEAQDFAGTAFGSKMLGRQQALHDVFVLLTESADQPAPTETAPRCRHASKYGRHVMCNNTLPCDNPEHNVYRCKHVKLGDGGIVDGCGWQGGHVTRCPGCGSHRLALLPNPRLVYALADPPGPRGAVAREALASARLDGETHCLETEPQGAPQKPGGGANGA